MVDPDGLIAGWFRLDHPEPGVVTIEEPLHEERVKSYLVVGNERAVLIDTGMGVGDLRSLVDGLTDRPLTVVNSHAHWDHVGGNAAFVGRAEILIHAAEARDLERGVPNSKVRAAFAEEHRRGPLPVGFDPATAVIAPTRADRALGGGEWLDLGGRTLEVIHAPGHSPGGIVLLDRGNGALFSTDVAYPEALYCFATGTDLDAYRATMAGLAALAPTLRVVYPSHGVSPMAPEMLPRMRDALDAIGEGRPADEVADGKARHRFDGFAVLVAVGAAVG